MNQTFNLSTAEELRRMALNRKKQELSDAKSDFDKAAAHAAFGYNLDIILLYIFNAAADAKQVALEVRMSS